MRELDLRQATAELLVQAQAAAIQAIGLRGDKARSVMRATVRETKRKQGDERWKAILRSAWKSRCDPVSEVELGLVDTSTTSDGSTATLIDA